jgi:hypothetical protein
LHAGGEQFIFDQQLQEVLACQAVRRENQHPREAATPGIVAQAIQLGAYEAGAGVAVIRVEFRLLPAFLLEAITQFVDLGFDRALLLLPLRRHARIERYIYGLIHRVSSSPLLQRSRPQAPGAGKWYPVYQAGTR